LETLIHRLAVGIPVADFLNAPRRRECQHVTRPDCTGNAAKPLSNMVSLTPGGSDGITSLENDFVIADKYRTGKVFGNAL
jgi:hypothetical protein